MTFSQRESHDFQDLETSPLLSDRIKTEKVHWFILSEKQKNVFLREIKLEWCSSHFSPANHVHCDCLQ